MKIIYVLLVVVFLVGGCTNISAPVKTAIENKVASADDKVTSAVDRNVQSTDTEATLKKCEEAINYQVLIDALPTGVDGYVAGEPTGNMLTFGGDPTNPDVVLKYSTASVSLTKDDKNIEVTATDTCYIQSLSTMWLGYYEMEGTDGYLKKATISGYPGWHQYSKSSDSYSYNVFVKDRVIVSVQGSNGVTDSDVEAAAKSVGYASIVAAAR